jgi:GntR family transcriptional regulator / MocR family aminotransferase
MRPAVDLDLPLALDPDVGEPLHRQLAAQLAAAVRAGRLPRDARLPASRTLARRLGVARGVVLAAYDELTAQGFLEGRHGSGTYVAATLPAVLSVPRRPAPRHPDADATARVADLRPGMPDARTLPDAAWRRAWWRARTALDVDDEGRAPGGGGGTQALRSALAGYLVAARGLAVDASEITVTAGSREALALLALAVGITGRDVVVEEPGYPRAVALFRRLGARIVPVPVDDQGLRTDLLPRGAPGRQVAAVHVTPSHQYPLGGVLPLHRRAALLAWAGDHGAVVVEDDYDGEFRYEVPPLPALAALAEGAPVAYLGTFSKTLTPALRAGFLVVPGPLADAVEAARADLGAPVPAPVQQALAEYVASGGLGRHVTRMRRDYGRSRSLVVGALAGAAGVAAVRGAQAGLHLVVETWDGGIAAAVQEECARRDVLVPTLAEYYVDRGRPHVHGLVIGYAGEPPERLRAGLDVVVAALDTAGRAPTVDSRTTSW